MDFYFNYNSAQITSDFLFSNENTIAEGFRVLVLYTPQIYTPNIHPKYIFFIFFLVNDIIFCHFLFLHKLVSILFIQYLCVLLFEIEFFCFPLISKQCIFWKLYQIIPDVQYLKIKCYINVVLYCRHNILLRKVGNKSKLCFRWWRPCFFWVYSWRHVDQTKY